MGTPGLGGLPGGSDPTSPKKPKVSIEPAGSSPMTQTPLLLTPKEPRLTLLPQSQLKEPDRGQHEVLTPLIMKRKRGRPRILDAPGEVNPFAQTRLPEQVSCVFSCYLCFVHPIFGFWSLLPRKLRKYKNIM